MKIKTLNLFDLEKTIANDYLSDFIVPWDALGGIKDYIETLRKGLPKDRYEQIAEKVWVAKSASVSPTAHIGSHCIIDEGAEVRHCAYIRGSAIIGKNAVVGNSTEIKNSILFDGVQVAHFNYVGDSVLGYKSHLGAGAITSNVKSDKSHITVDFRGEKIETGLKKFGAIVADYCEIGCNAVLCPGSVLGRLVTVYPLCMVRGYIEESCIVKNSGEIKAKI